MTTNKAKGTRWESQLVRVLGEYFRGRHADGLVPRRVAQEGYKDSGDIHGLGVFIAQAKDWKSWQDAIREGLDGAEKQKGHAGSEFGVALVKRARRSTGGGYAVMTIETFARLLYRLELAESLIDASPADYSASYWTAVQADRATPFPK